ncbi:MAG TPA: choice-of-anchor tandem repeat GloVer-containing protein [Thermoanaerobaculia bacterium]|jgi:uncharacterized repeat protein (TIGR03803 family)
MEACRLRGVVRILIAAAIAAGASSARAQVYEVVRALDGNTGTPFGRLYEDASGNLYGTTDLGGLSGIGSTFRLEPDGGGGFTFHELHAFVGVDGQQPIGGLVTKGDGFLYGSTTSGGLHDYGTLFSIDPSGRVTTIHDFTSTEGWNSGSTLAVGSDGLYGTTSGVGNGIVYRVHGSGTLDVVHTFNGTDGSQPFGGVILGSDGWFYGTTYGGPGGASTIYRVSSAGDFETLHVLTTDEGGSIQRGVTEARGHFYGVAPEGGANGMGTAFRVDATGSFAKIHDFNSGGDDGADPGAAILAGSDGNLYGSTRSGGSGGFGTIFRIDLSDALATVHSFTGVDGREPNSQLLEGVDGNLYGPTSYSTAGPGIVYGEIFRFHPPAGALDVLYAFPPPPAAHPLAGLVQAASGDFFGTASQGGAASNGSVFRLAGDVTDESVSVVHDFQGDDGFTPALPLTRAADGSLYGLTSEATTSGGTVYRVDPPSTFTLLHSFTPEEGSAPNAPLLEVSPGSFYGVTDLGGVGGHGNAFQMDTSGAITPFYDFQTTDGTFPHSLMKALDGNIYGTAIAGGLPSSAGSVFQIVLPSQTVTPFHLFDTTEGYIPAGPLVQTEDGTFYGATQSGGDSFNGTIFTMNAAGETSTLHSFDGSEGNGVTSGLLLAADGTFYGTRFGGSGGILYQITTDGQFSILHGFGQGLDGSGPVGNLIQASNQGIYGVTQTGGAGQAGIIFRFCPAPCSNALVTTGPPLNFMSGPASGGTSVRLSAAGLFLGATVDVGGVDVPAVVLDTHTLIFVTPPLPPTTMPVITIANPGGATLSLNGFWFADFLDVNSIHPFYTYVDAVGRARITAGCGNGNYCPDAEVTREQMAVFLLKAEHGSGHVPPQCKGIFADVPCTPGVGFPDWIEELYAEQITGGCQTGPLLYCPDRAVTRAEMAVFLLKTKHGTGYVPNSCAGIFADVPCPATPEFPYSDWIEQLYADAITGGCAVGPLRYCPDNPNLRGEMAVFLTKTFDLP